MRRLILVIHNVRSCHNVGSMFRIADGMGVEKIYLTGYSPYPLHKNDPRMPHEAQKAARQINKTALGAEKSVTWGYKESFFEVLEKLNEDSFEVVALEQTEKAQDLTFYTPKARVAVVAGSEINGLPQVITNKIDNHLQIPMLGKKESLNVAAAASICLYHLRYAPFNFKK